MANIVRLTMGMRRGTVEPDWQMISHPRPIRSKAICAVTAPPRLLLNTRKVSSVNPESFQPMYRTGVEGGKRSTNRTVMSAGLCRAPSIGPSCLTTPAASVGEAPTSRIPARP